MLRTASGRIMKTNYIISNQFRSFTEAWIYIENNINIYSENAYTDLFGYCILVNFLQFCFDDCSRKKYVCHRSCSHLVHLQHEMMMNDEIGSVVLNYNIWIISQKQVLRLWPITSSMFSQQLCWHCSEKCQHFINRIRFLPS